MMTNLPEPASPGGRKGAGVVLGQVLSESHDVGLEVVFPVHVLHAEIKELLVRGMQPSPKSLHIFVVETPLLCTEVGNDVRETLDLFVHFHHPKIQVKYFNCLLNILENGSGYILRLPED